MRRLAIVLSHPVQYYSPWFRWLRAHTALEFRVFYLWNFGVSEQHDPQFRTRFQWDIDLLSGYDHEFVPNVARAPGTHHFRGLDNPALTARLAAWQPEALLLFGYNWLSHQRAFWWARRHGVPLLLRGDSHLLGRGLPSWPHRRLLGFLFKRFAAFACVGAANRDYFRAFGVCFSPRTPSTPRASIRRMPPPARRRSSCAPNSDWPANAWFFLPANSTPANNRSSCCVLFKRWRPTRMR